MSVTWYTATIIKIEEATPNTRRFWFEVEDLPRFDFKPGQFVTFDFPIGEKPKERWRSYSIASAPDGSNVIELVIVHLEHGKATTFLFNEGEIGLSLPMMGPLGHFCLPEKIENDLCFVCTGTGIAPFRSMLQDIKKNNLPYKNLYLIFGTRNIDDVLYYDEMTELARKLPNFKYIVTLSREAPPDWQGGKGYVHAIYEDIFSDKRPADFYLCGWRLMIDEARQRLKDMGYDHKHIHLEIYG